MELLTRERGILHRIDPFGTTWGISLASDIGHYHIVRKTKDGKEFGIPKGPYPKGLDGTWTKMDYAYTAIDIYIETKWDWSDEKNKHKPVGKKTEDIEADDIIANATDTSG